MFLGSNADLVLFMSRFYAPRKGCRRVKTESIEASEADIVVTACPGCQFQLLDNSARLKKPQKVMSLMEAFE